MKRFSSLLVILVALLAAIPAAAQTEQKLFFIQRSKNLNEVHYDARVTENGALDPARPVEGYWLNKASDGSRSPIKSLQRPAYGFDVIAGADGTSTMKLRAVPARPLTLVRVEGKWRARLTINGAEAYLTKLYVASDDSGLFPRVLYVDIFGDDVTSGAAVQERFRR